MSAYRRRRELPERELAEIKLPGDDRGPRAKDTRQDHKRINGREIDPTRESDQAFVPTTRLR